MRVAGLILLCVWSSARPTASQSDRRLSHRASTRGILPLQVGHQAECGDEDAFHGSCKVKASTDEIFNDTMPFETGEALLKAVVIEGELLVVNAEQVKRGGVEFVAVGDVFDGFEAEFVGAAVAAATLDAATGHPGGESSGVVVAAFAAALRSGLATEFGGADDECFIEQTA